MPGPFHDGSAFDPVSTGAYGPCDAVVDLRGRALGATLAGLEAVLAEPRPAPARVAVLIDPPVPGAGPSLFQPVGRRIAEARRAGLLRGARPVPPGEGMAGFVIEFGG